MSSDSIQSRLDRISTHWTAVIQAHTPDESGVQPVRVGLLHRYRGAAFRYLLAMVRDVDVAEELSQQFALKFLEGDFHRATPGRGRFRDYLKTTLINLVRRHHKSKALTPRALPEEFADPTTTIADDESDREFVCQWRQELMDQTWGAMKEEWPVYHSLLRLRTSEPELTSQQMAERYTRETNQPMTSANVRKTMARAHAKFSDLLVREVADSLESPTRDDLCLELEELDLLKYCRPAMDKWKGS